MIKLTDIALEKVRLNLKKRGRGIGIKVEVKTTGCSGLAYVLEYVDDTKFDPNYDVGVYPDFVIKIPTKDKHYLKGVTLDWVKKGLNEGFEFINPNEIGRCGCGESFRV